MTMETSPLLPGTSMSDDGAASRRSRSTLLTGFLLAAAGFVFGAVVFRGGGGTEGAEASIITLDLEGMKKSKHYSGDHHDCADGKYSKRTLQLAYELPFAALFRDNKGQRKYEASSVIVVGDDAYAICDSSWAISKFGSNLQPFADTNVQIGEVNREKDESGYEAIFHENGTFFVVRESIKHDDKTYHAVIEELALSDQDYEVKDACSAEFTFEGDSKGFEGAIALQDLNNEMVILGLCEGNHCSETRKNDKGNGRLVAMRKETIDMPDGTSNCQWKTIRMIHIPSSVMFKDYSAITLSDSGKAGISSQEESQFWVGQLFGQTADGLWDIDGMEFDSERGSLFDFPKNDSCETVYCNVEGVHWINDDTIMAVSDKMKGKGKQDFRCFDKDQSVHVFVLPH